MKMSLICVFGIAVFVGFGEGIEWIIVPTVVVGVLAGGLLLLGGLAKRAYTPQLAHVHPPQNDAAEARRVETHEVKGHMKAGRKLGGSPVRVDKYTVRPNLPKGAPMEHYVAFYHAGRVAQGSRVGCGPDEKLERYAASFAPSPGKALRAGRALARRLV